MDTQGEEGYSTFFFLNLHINFLKFQKFCSVNFYKSFHALAI